MFRLLNNKSFKKGHESNVDIQHYLVSEKSSIKDALKQIENNSSGCVFVESGEKKIVGMATDGDIRRYLIKGKSTEESIASCMNRDFISVPEGTTREKVLKLLDAKIQVIPELSEEKKLLRVFTRKSFPLKMESPVYVRAKSPVRISFSGGGSDLTHFFVKHGGVVLNSTVTLYSKASLRKRNDEEIVIFSKDLNKQVSFKDMDELKRSDEMPLILSLIKLIEPQFGLELHIESEFPLGSGLGGSAVVLSSIIGCFNQYREDRWDNYEMAELAFQAERIALGIAGGWQDQYATVFGGFNFMEFHQDNNIVYPLRIHHDVIQELESNLILCYTGKNHFSGEIQEEQKARYEEGDNLKKLLEENKKLTYEMKTHLLKGQLNKFGRCLHKMWYLKRQFSPKVTTEALDGIYQTAINHGALGGKLLGAGGGGYFLFYVRPFKKLEVLQALEEQGFQCQNILFEDKGLQTWSTREDHDEK